MRKLIVGAQVSMDGVMQAPGLSTEDPTNGFRFGGWVMPYADREFGEEMDHLFHTPFALLLGRKTYEIFAAYWPYYAEDGPHGGIAKLFNGSGKYVVSRSGEVDTGWQGTVLLRDVADVERLKAEDGPDLLTQGSTELVHALLARDLVDAISTFTIPVVLGGGKKLFADGSSPHAYRLTRSRVSGKGILIGHYDRDGEIKTGGLPLETPSDREIARQARMKREGSSRTAPPFYHGTRADLRAGDLLAPGFASNYQVQKLSWIYFSGTLDAAIWGCELAKGDGPQRIYIVEPTGEFEDDPNLTDTRFPGNPTKSYRSRAPLRIAGEVTEWEPHPPERVKEMKDFLARMAAEGDMKIID